MKKRMLRTFVAVGALASGLALVGGLPSTAEADWREDAIVEAFDDVLGREPSDRELRRYRDLMRDEGWTERDVRDDLRERPDERRHSRRSDEDPEKVIRRAYEDILDREPDREGLRLYRSRMIDDDWTEDEVRKALRESPEYATHRKERAEKIIREAYEDVLGREPDKRGLESYRAKVMNQDWTGRDVRKALKESPEYRQKSRMTREQAEEVVRRAYEDVLGREPDAGSRVYVDKVLRERWSEADVAKELRKSDEYRNRER